MRVCVCSLAGLDTRARVAVPFQIYKLTAKPMINGVFRGRNPTVFAYGQTGSGKTFTMMGTNEMSKATGKRRHPGIYVLAAQDLFKHLSKPEHSDLDMCVSFYEIYG